MPSTVDVGRGVATTQVVPTAYDASVMQVVPVVQGAPATVQAVPAVYNVSTARVFPGTYSVATAQGAVAAAVVTQGEVAAWAVPAAPYRFIGPDGDYDQLQSTGSVSYTHLTLPTNREV